MASTIWRLATMSPRSIRFASSISCSRGQQLDPADRAQVEAQRVEARLDRQVELGLLRLPRLARLLRLLVGGDAVLGDHVDAVLDQVGVQVADLLLGDLDLLERGGDLLEGQVAALAPLGDQRAQLLGVRKRGSPFEPGGRLLAAVACRRPRRHRRRSAEPSPSQTLPAPSSPRARGPGGAKYMGWPARERQSSPANLGRPASRAAAAARGGPNRPSFPSASTLQ